MAPMVFPTHCSRNGCPVLNSSISAFSWTQCTQGLYLQPFHSRSAYMLKEEVMFVQTGGQREEKYGRPALCVLSQKRCVHANIPGRRQLQAQRGATSLTMWEISNQAGLVSQAEGTLPGLTTGTESRES